MSALYRLYFHEIRYPDLPIFDTGANVERIRVFHGGHWAWPILSRVQLFWYERESPESLTSIFRQAQKSFPIQESGVALVTAWQRVIYNYRIAMYGVADPLWAPAVQHSPPKWLDPTCVVQFVLSGPPKSTWERLIDDD